MSNLYRLPKSSFRAAFFAKRTSCAFTLRSLRLLRARKKGSIPLSSCKIFQLVRGFITANCFSLTEKIYWS